MAVIKMVRVEDEEEASKRTENMSLDFLVRKHLDEDLRKYYDSVGQKPLEDQVGFSNKKCRIIKYFCYSKLNYIFSGTLLQKKRQNISVQNLTRMGAIMWDCRCYPSKFITRSRKVAER